MLVTACFLASRFDPVRFTSKAFKSKAAVFIGMCAGRQVLNYDSIGLGGWYPQLQARIAEGNKKTQSGNSIKRSFFVEV